jgi:S-adenosylmethionine synthetase
LFKVTNKCDVVPEVLTTLRSGYMVESVSPDHVDRLCDRAADAILDAFVKIDPLARTGIEIVVNSRIALLTGEVSVVGLTESKINEIGLTVFRSFLDVAGYGGIPIQPLLRHQDSELTIASAKGAGDQSICVGFATDRTRELVTSEHLAARALSQKLWELSHSEPRVGRDGKVIILGSDSGLEAYIRWQNDGSDIAKDIILDAASSCNCAHAKLNLGASFVHGSFRVDTGVLGRKLVCDAYGTCVPIGGGAISGKDASKVDRFGNYTARWAACELVRQFGGDALVWLAYTLGCPEPVAASFRCLTASKILSGVIQPSEMAVDVVRRKFGLYETCSGFFEQIATRGHFGWGYPWD